MYSLFQRLELVEAQIVAFHGVGQVSSIGLLLSVCSP